MPRWRSGSRSSFPRSGPSDARTQGGELTMLRTRICELLGIEHPIVLGGMGSATSPELVAAVCEAGGFGVLGATRQSPEELARDAAGVRAPTSKPFGLNLLLFPERPRHYDGLLAPPP